jgi:hypothetical protein
VRGLGGRRWGTSIAVASAALLLTAQGAFACELPLPRLDAKERPLGVAAETLPGARIATAALAPPAPGKPSTTTFEAVVTRNPDTPAFLEAGWTRPDEACSAPVCNEVTVDVPARTTSVDTTTLYVRLSWPNQLHYVHLWGIAPDGSVVGKTNVIGDFDKAVGNELTIPVAAFTVPNPQPGTWRIQARAVFGHRIPVRGLVALSAGPPVAYPRDDVRTLADRHLTQHLTYNIVFAGREWSKEEVAAFREHLPLEYRQAAYTKERADCGGYEDNGLVSTDAWSVCHFTGTTSEGAAGAKPYFEPVKLTFEHRFLQADERWTRDLFAAMKAATTHDEPFAETSQRNYLPLYDAQQGRANRGPGAEVSDPAVGDKIDAVTVEDWVFDHRLDQAYARSFTDLETGERVSGSFITPDPAARYDPYYTGKGGRDVGTAPQGPATSFTFFVLDTFTDEALTRDYFDRDAYHFFDVSRVMIDPDTGRERGPDYARVWGGRYRFFLHDLGAGPNSHEVATSFTGNVAGSAAYPSGDPPIWDYDNDPRWAGKLPERTARDAVTMLLYRLVAPYIYRPIPADVYLLASNNWNDCYANPQCSPDGISKTDLTKVYRPDYVEQNLAAAIPAATFVSERSFPNLRTFRDLGCARQRAVANPNRLVTAGNDAVVLAPDPNCVGKPSDPLQEALEAAKARGDDLVGPGVNDFGVSTHVMRAYIEEHRDELAPQPPGQFTITSVSAVFGGSGIWFLPIPGAAGGVAVTTPHGEAWGIFQSLNDFSKPPASTQCELSSPVAPGCGTVPPVSLGTTGFSYSLQHEAAHFFGLWHPHDSVTVEKDADGKWQKYGYSYRYYGDFSQAPTSYAGAFTPYSVLDQDILQRGHTAEHLRRMQDWLSDAYLLDGAAGLPAPSEATTAKVRESTMWRDVATGLFECGDYLHAERAMRNADLAAQGVFGPVVAPRPLQPGERVLFAVDGQRAYGPDGRLLPACEAAVAAAARANASAGSSAGPGPGGSSGVLPSTGSGPASTPMLLCMALAGVAVLLRRRCAPRRSHDC